MVPEILGPVSYLKALTVISSPKSIVFGYFHPENAQNKHPQNPVNPVYQINKKKNPFISP
jgi:hypothetical protein